MGARERLIASTVDLMRRDGVAGTGLARLLAVSGTARRSLYLHFPGGKAELIDHATVTVGEAIGALLDQLAAERDPVTAIRTFMAIWTAALADSGFTAGCPVVAAALGRGEAPAAADTAGRVFGGWQQRLAGYFASAQHLPPQDADELAATTIAAVEGAVIMCQATGSAEPLQHVERSLTRLLRGGQPSGPVRKDTT